MLKVRSTTLIDAASKHNHLPLRSIPVRRSGEEARLHLIACSEQFLEQVGDLVGVRWSADCIVWGECGMHACV